MGLPDWITLGRSSPAIIKITTLILLRVRGRSYGRRETGRQLHYPGFAFLVFQEQRRRCQTPPQRTKNDFAYRLCQHGLGKVFIVNDYQVLHK